MPHARRLKPDGAERPFKTYTPFYRAELKQIDRWGFGKHIRNRADAVRFLVMKALASEGVR